MNDDLQIVRLAAAQLEKRLAPHLGRLKLGGLFPSCQAEWRGRDAEDLHDTILRMCEILDDEGPSMIQKARIDRCRALGFPPSYRQRAGRRSKDSYLEVMTPIVTMLEDAARPGYLCGWNETGCKALHQLLQSMLDKIRYQIPSLIVEISLADRQYFEDMRGQI